MGRGVALMRRRDLSLSDQEVECVDLLCSWGQTVEVDGFSYLDEVGDKVLFFKRKVKF